MKIKQVKNNVRIMGLPMFSILLLLMVFIVGSCSDNTNINEFIISQEEERQLGEDFDKQIRSGKMGEQIDGTVWEPETEGELAFAAYFDSLGYSIAEQIDERYMEDLYPEGISNRKQFFKFTLIESDVVNAFAVPGGFVYFYTAILKEFNSEAELAGVIAHELAHIVMHHSRDQMIKQGMLTLALDAVLGEGLTGDLVGGMIGLSNSRSDEFEADSLGTKYIADAGLYPYGIRDFFATGLEFDADGKCVTSTTENISSMFKTHPPSCDRVNATNAQINKMPEKVKTQPKNAERYKELVDAAF
jgi:predicted Zn-dependent protease